MDSSLKVALENAISRATGDEFQIERTKAVSGGCIHNSLIIIGENGGRFFVKTNTREAFAMFKAEAEALEVLARAKTIRVPKPIHAGQISQQAYLILEALSFSVSNQTSWEEMGQQLAALHHHTAGYFGWSADNWIGATPQINNPENDWSTFFREHRLKPQLKIASRKGYRFAQADKLLASVEALLRDHRPKPSLLHGDLWSGNAGFCDDGTPVIFDPASYYGDRETDLAFTKVFGGFPAAFYDAYTAAFPLEPGHETRSKLYNLYHILNHANLFGGGYINEAGSMIHELVNR
ncbi:MAG: fructosamine kinase family protein [Verrucomicrobiota bacterium]